MLRAATQPKARKKNPAFHLSENNTRGKYPELEATAEHHPSVTTAQMVLDTCGPRNHG